MLWKHLAAGLLTVLILATNGPAEEKLPQIISGKIIDAETEAPIEGVRLWIPGTTIETKSDIMGEFVLRGVPDTNFMIWTEDTAYNDVTVDRLLPCMQNSTVELRLHRMTALDKLMEYCYSFPPTGGVIVMRSRSGPRGEWMNIVDTLLPTD